LSPATFSSLVYQTLQHSNFFVNYRQKRFITFTPGLMIQFSSMPTFRDKASLSAGLAFPRTKVIKL
jgi:hypothetical protein